MLNPIYLLAGVKYSISKSSGPLKSAKLYKHNKYRNFLLVERQVHFKEPNNRISKVYSRAR